MDPDTLLPMAYSIKVFLSCTVLIHLMQFVAVIPHKVHDTS